jgi:hypothetical protein
MRKPSPQAVKAQKYLDKNPVTSPKALQHKFGISYQVAYNLVKHRRAREAELDSVPSDERQIITGFTGKQYEVMDFTPMATYGQTIDATGEQLTDAVNHPAHYKTGGIEVIDFIEAKELNYRLGNVVKYISRADYKGDKLENLKKAQWYLNREIEKLVG